MQIQYGNYVCDIRKKNDKYIYWKDNLIALTALMSDSAWKLEFESDSHLQKAWAGFNSPNLIHNLISCAEVNKRIEKYKHALRNEMIFFTKVLFALEWGNGSSMQLWQNKGVEKKWCESKKRKRVRNRRPKDTWYVKKKKWIRISL